MKKQNNEQGELNVLRKQLETADTIIVSLLAIREEAVLKIEKIKRGMGKPVFSKELEDRRINLAMTAAKNFNMSERSQRFVGKLFKKIIIHCRNSETLQRRKAEGKK